MSEKPGGVLLYDSLDRPNADKKANADNKTYMKIGWEIALVGVLLFCIMALLLYFIHAWAWSLFQDYEYRNIGMLLLSFMYVSLSILFLGPTVVFIRWLWIKSGRASLINAMEHQTTIQQLMRGNTTTQFFDVMGRRADKSTFASAQNITYSPHHSVSNQNTLPEPTEQDIALDVDDEIPATTLQALQDKNYIGRSGNSLLIGFGEDEVS